MSGTDAPAFPLRLVPAEEDGKPAGLRLARADAAALLDRITPRIARYATLRLALVGEEAVLFAPDASDRSPLPWCETPLGWLATAGPLLLPFGLRLDVPAPWRAEVARRLLDRHGLAGPALLAPRRCSRGGGSEDGGLDGRSGANGGLRLLDLAGSRPIPEVDAARLRGRS